MLEDQQNIRLIRELLQTLYTSLCTLVQRVGKSVLVGNINMWVYRMETILHWQQQLNNIQITRVSKALPSPGPTSADSSSPRLRLPQTPPPPAAMLSGLTMAGHRGAPESSDFMPYPAAEGGLGGFLIKGRWEEELDKMGSKDVKDDSQMTHCGKVKTWL